MSTTTPRYPNERKRGCDRCNHYLGHGAICPVCGWEDRDKLEDRAVAHAERLGYARVEANESAESIVTFTEREFRALSYIKHARLYGIWQSPT